MKEFLLCVENWTAYYCLVKIKWMNVEKNSKSKWLCLVLLVKYRDSHLWDSFTGRFNFGNYSALQICYKMHFHDIFFKIGALFTHWSKFLEEYLCSEGESMMYSTRPFFKKQNLHTKDCRHLLDWQWHIYLNSWLHRPRLSLISEYPM